MAQREKELVPAASVIGEGTAIAGQVSGDEDLRLLGRVDGSIELSGALVVEPSGIAKADIKVRSAVIHGVVVGTITAAESVELAPGSRVVGDVTAPRVILAEGAAYRGRVDMGDLDLPRAELERAVRPVQARPLLAPRTAAARPPVRPASPLPRMAPPAPRPAPVRPPPPPAPVEVPAEVIAAVEGDGPPPVPASASALGARRKVVVKKK